MILRKRRIKWLHLIGPPVGYLPGVLVQGDCAALEPFIRVIGDLYRNGLTVLYELKIRFISDS